MSQVDFAVTELVPFGAEVHFDLSIPLDDTQQALLRALLYQNGVLVFRKQSLSDDDQARVLSHFGSILSDEGEVREISPDGNLGSCHLLYHADLAFTAEPFKLISLYGIDVVEGGTSTRFASGRKVLGALAQDLREHLSTLTATTVIPPSQTERSVRYDMPASLPQINQPAIILHPVTKAPILFVFEMMTARLDELQPAESETLLQELFGYLYDPANVYEHFWQNGDLVIWDNIALQHGRPDQAGAARRRLRRICVADKTFFQLCPQFRTDDPMVQSWGAGQKLMI